MTTDVEKDAMLALCERGNEITWDDIMAFTKFKTLSEALLFIKDRRMDVFSYYKNNVMCVTLLAKLFDFNRLRPNIITPTIQHLLDDAKQKGTLEQCARTPCWVSLDNRAVFMPIAVLIRTRARDVIQFVPYLVVQFDVSWWCTRNTIGTHNALADCTFFNNPQCLAAILDCVRPRLPFCKKGWHSDELQKIYELYADAGDACRAMAWCCGKKNAGGVWYDLWVCVAERWDYRADSWVDAEVSEKRLKK